MERQLGHLSSMSSDLSLSVECAQASEQLSRLGDGAGRRGREPGQLGWIGRAPEGQFEQQRRQVGIEHFRRAARGQGLVLPGCPEPSTDTRFETAGSATPLLGRVLGDANRVQPCES